MNNNHQSETLRLTIVILCLLISKPVTASEKEYFLRNETFCSVGKDVCITGTLSYAHRTGSLKLRGRVKSAIGPGLLQIRLTGTNRLGGYNHTEMEVPLRGKSSEIINHEMITNTPEIEHWTLSTISYLPGFDKQRR